VNNSTEHIGTERNVDADNSAIYPHTIIDLFTGLWLLLCLFVFLLCCELLPMFFIISFTAFKCYNMATAMATYPFHDDACVICRCALSDDGKGSAVKVTSGIKTLLEYSIKYSDAELTIHLTSNPPFVMVHSDCRINFTSKRRFEQLSNRQSADNVESNEPQKKLRSTVDVFEWKLHCFICGQSAVIDDRHPDRNDVVRVEGLGMKERMLSVCDDRGDLWAEEVKLKLLASLTYQLLKVGIAVVVKKDS